MKISELKLRTGIVGHDSAGRALVRCVPREDFPGGWMFWCPYCRMVHRHGRGLGDRAVHCRDFGTGFGGYDYVLVADDADILAAKQAELGVWPGGSP
jgi:hypothetical protein